ncbi:Uncharacterised protein [Bordetella pertussis]|nr:Uncharacterised protein [Bordetella pertussis]
MASDPAKPLLALTNTRLGITVFARNLNASPLIVKCPQMKEASQILRITANIRDQLGSSMRTGVNKGTYAAILTPDNEDGNARVIQCSIVAEIRNFAFMTCKFPGLCENILQLVVKYLLRRVDVDINIMVIGEVRAS